MCNINERPLKKKNEHKLKIWPEFFNAVLDGTKKFEIRKNDRNFQVGDKIILKEWNPSAEKFTGRSLAKWINFIVPGGKFGINKDFCVIGLKSFRGCVYGGLIHITEYCSYWDHHSKLCAKKEKCRFQEKELFFIDNSREATVSLTKEDIATSYYPLDKRRKKNENTIL
ncbi:MAG: ASCH/PUA domain-containing protein [Promethearchaeota archaeon]